MKTLSIRTAWILAAALLFGVGTAEAAEVQKSYQFALDNWQEIGASDGPVSLHRIRLETKKGRLSKSAMIRPHNQEYLDTIVIQLEYTNESSSNWKARITARWLDEEGRVIDGLSANEKLGKKSARKVTGVSVSTLKYGLEVAKTLEIDIRYEP